MNNSQNFCGRYVQYPHFGALEEKDIYAPPGVPVRPSVCQTYYITRDPTKMSQDCRDCIYNEYNITMPPGNNTPNSPYTCACSLQRDFTPDNFCDYARCVQDQHKLNGSCARPFAAIYNLDDVKDAEFIDPFNYEQMAYCARRV
jgi:hypothetical protein